MPYFYPSFLSRASTTLLLYFEWEIRRKSQTGNWYSKSFCIFGRLIPEILCMRGGDVCTSRLWEKLLNNRLIHIILENTGKHLILHHYFNLEACMSICLSKTFVTPIQVSKRKKKRYTGAKNTGTLTK